MAYFAGLQTFDENGRLCFDSIRRWVRFLDKIVMKDQANTGQRTYSIPYGSIIVSPFTIYYEGSENQYKVWEFEVNENIVSWYRWWPNDWPRPANDPFFVFVMWVD